MELSQAQKKPEKKRAHIPVRTHIEPRRSPHIVDLKKDRTNPLSSVEVFREKIGKSAKRETVDFGMLVRRAATGTHELQKEAHALPKPLSALSILKGPGSRRGMKTLKDRVRDRVERVREGVRSPRALAGALAVLFFLIAPFPATSYYRELKDDRAAVVAASTNGFSLLYDSTHSTISADLPSAKAQLEDAVVSFGKAIDIIHQEHSLLVSFVSMLPFVGRTVEDQARLVRTGHHVSLGNAYLLKGFDEIAGFSLAPLTERMEILEQHLAGALPQYHAALGEIALAKIPESLAKEPGIFLGLQSLFATFVDDLVDLNDLLSTVRLLFGDEHPKRYLLLFQNEHEIRPTGGFIGSFAVIDIQRGRLLGVETPEAGSYDLQGQTTLHRLPPEPLRLVNGRWEFQDINWFPDFPMTAEQAAVWYQNARGRTVDGVIAINGAVLEKVLQVLGAVEDKESGLLLTSETALDLIEGASDIETASSTPSRPKAIIGRLLDDILSRLSALSKENLLSLFLILNQALEQKDIQLSLFDTEVQKRIEAFGWSGRIRQTAFGEDYLSVIHANLQGQKSDAKIEQKIVHAAEIQEDGSVIDTVRIIRRHTGSLGEPRVGVPNITYTRLFTPLGSELLKVEGFTFPPESAFHASLPWYEVDPLLAQVEQEVGIHRETGTRITEEFGKTVFGNWMIVLPGETREIIFRYRLPFALFDSSRISTKTPFQWNELIFGKENKRTRYQLVIQKQSGVFGDLSTTVVLPSEWRAIWTTPETFQKDEGRLFWEIPFQEDRILGLVLERGNVVE